MLSQSIKLNWISSCIFKSDWYCGALKLISLNWGDFEHHKVVLKKYIRGLFEQTLKWLRYSSFKNSTPLSPGQESLTENNIRATEDLGGVCLELRLTDHKVYVWLLPNLYHKNRHKISYCFLMFVVWFSQSCGIHWELFQDLSFMFNCVCSLLCDIIISSQLTIPQYTPIIKSEEA